ncbi:uncharacterized protein TRAVEDRAFT_50429 [Trametes versicolor FP-101664 SS1]|uniref:uncharacterized protein n=1 Tax=Trametes versicolor (strain FP-101664) TaxID=717944 RepID=UPI0004623672|nr:uncharacterized protein TRAVEDRAFT_50429 [Trametes versicolor FP-101664 SS1]EIW55940.1 hypothetical protein TRAVEDRAFT_50429 [Trametes versicolor FP-101664 SS1]
MADSSARIIKQETSIMDFDTPSPPLFRSEDLEAMHVRMLRRPPQYAAATMTSSELSEYIRHQRMFLQDHLINWEQRPWFYVGETVNGTKPPSPLPYVHDPFLFMAASPEPDASPLGFTSPLPSPSSPDHSLSTTQSSPPDIALPTNASEDPSVTSPATPEDALDEDEVDEYLLQPGEKVAARAATLAEPDPPALLSAFTRGRALLRKLLIPSKRGKKRTRRQVAEEDKENERAQRLRAEEPAAGSSTAPARYPARKRAKRA